MTEQLIIDGERAEASDRGTFEVSDPSSGGLLATVAKATKDDVDRAVNAAQAALDSKAWGGAAPADRGRILYRIAQALRDRAEELANLESRDNGKPLRQSRTDLQVAARYFEFFAGIADKIMVNANGPQELFVYALTRKGRVETTNYRTVKLPADMDLPEYLKQANEFASFYKAMFARQVQNQDGRAVFLEYGWDMRWCDPCAADPLANSELRQLGVFWSGDGGGTPDAFLTRLHVRYDNAHFPEDLVFQETGDRTNFQGRYVLRHVRDSAVRILYELVSPQQPRREQCLRERDHRDLAFAAHDEDGGWKVTRARFNLAFAGVALATLGSLAVFAQQQNFDNVQINIQKAQGNVYMISSELPELLGMGAVAVDIKAAHVAHRPSSGVERYVAEVDHLAAQLGMCWLLRPINLSPVVMKIFML